MSTLVFIPGLLLTPRLYDPQVAAFRGDYPVVHADTLGMDSITAMAEKALSAVAGDIIPVGLSMGGYVALEMARLAPQRLKGLIIMDSNAAEDTPERKQERQRLIEMSRIGKFHGASKALLATFVAPGNINDETITRPIMVMAEEVGRENFFLQQQAIMARRDQFDTLKGLDCPGLFIVGSEDIPFLEPVRAMAAAMKNSTYVEIEGAGHLPTLEDPDAVNAAMAAFLARHYPFG
ncbi:MAG: alpha/beta fold hydrolase [Candidatus Puniceispirillales bacterium]